MSTQNLFQYDYHFQSVIRRAAQGAVTGLILMIIFMYGDNVIGNKDWYFTFREYFPMITIAAGGAFGGIFYAVMEPLRNQRGWRKTAVNVLCVVVFVFALWISAVAGFAVTGDWD